MKVVTPFLLVTFAILIPGCRTHAPFNEAVQGSKYSIQAFETAIISEKIAFVERQKRELVAPQANESFLVYERKYPTWSQWLKMKRKAKPGDEIVEFHHRLYASLFDGPAEADQHGYALVRDGIVRDYVPIDGVFRDDYGNE